MITTTSQNWEKKKKNPNVAPCFGKLFINESMVKGYTCNLWTCSKLGFQDSCYDPLYLWTHTHTHIYIYIYINVPRVVKHIL
jgi:hypothetical protein